MRNIIINAIQKAPHNFRNFIIANEFKISYITKTIIYPAINVNSKPNNSDNSLIISLLDYDSHH